MNAEPGRLSVLGQDDKYLGQINPRLGGQRRSVPDHEGWLRQDIQGRVRQSPNQDRIGAIGVDFKTKFTAGYVLGGVGIDQLDPGAHLTIWGIGDRFGHGALLVKGNAQFILGENGAG